MSKLEKQIIALVVVIIVSIVGYKMYTNWMTRKLADEYVEATIEETIELVRDAGLPDLKIECKKNQRAAFFNEFDDYLLEMDRPCYYYHLDLYSDAIVGLYRKKIKYHREEELLEMMDDIRTYVNRGTKCCGFGWWIVPYKDDYINAYFKHGYPRGSIFIESSSGDRYGYMVDSGQKRLYINDEIVYEKIEEPIDLPTVPEYIEPSDNTTPNYHYTGEYYDPYGVEDYDNPDDFADEMAEEFGDGSYDDGYDDAYDYWEEEHGY